MIYRSKAVCFLGALALIGASTALLVPQPASAQARGAAGGLKGSTLVIGGLIGLGAIGAVVALGGGGGGKKTTPPPKSP